MVEENKVKCALIFSSFIELEFHELTEYFFFDKHTETYSHWLIIELLTHLTLNLESYHAQLQLSQAELFLISTNK